jgi:hypothetical protein
MAIHPSCTCDIPRDKKLALQADHTCALEDSDDPPMARSEKSFHSLSEAMNALTKSGIRGAVVKSSDGRWYVETADLNTTTERFQKMQQSHKELSPRTIEFLKSMITKPDKATQLLDAIRGTTLDNRERAQVLAALERPMAKSIHSKRHVMTATAAVAKRAGMTSIPSGNATALPRPQPTRGLSTTPELEQQIVSEELTPEAAARAFVARRVPQVGMPGMKPTVTTDAYGVPHRPYIPAPSVPRS